jgi:predicted small lipoprotein YifL
MLDFPLLIRTAALTNMRSFMLGLVVAFSVSACGYRTPLTLPKPESKPPATAPAPGDTK